MAARPLRTVTPVVSDEPLMSLAAVCERLSMPVGTMYNLRLHKRGPRGYKIGGKVLFRWSEVEQWVQSQREPLR